MRAISILSLGLLVAAAILGLRWLSRGQAAQSTDEVNRAAHVRPLTQQDVETDRPLPLRPGSGLPDAALLDHNGREFRLADLRGRTLVLTFLYTHCNVPSMCPLAMAKCREARKLVHDRGMRNVEFIVVSFDAERDRPARLREFADRCGSDLPGFRLATGTAEEVGRLSRSLNTYYRQSAPGVFEHNIVVSIIDRDGILRDDFFGTDWSTEEFIRALAEVSR